MISPQPLIGVAVRDGVLVDIDDVESGLACNCQCPACGDRFVAKKGRIKAHHFAHRDNHQCKYGLETIAHWIAKEFLAKRKCLTVPPVYWKPATGCLLYPYSDITFATAELEKRSGDIIPDVVLRTAHGRELFVEIVVTHPVPPEKIQRIILTGVSALEIRLNGCEVLTAEILRRALLATSGEKNWLFNSKAAAFRKRFHEKDSEEKQSDYRRIPRYYGFFSWSLP